MAETTTDLHEIKVSFPNGSCMDADAQLLLDGEPMEYVESIAIEASADSPLVRCTIVRQYLKADATLGRMKLVYEGELEEYEIRGEHGPELTVPGVGATYTDVVESTVEGDAE